MTTVKLIECITTWQGEGIDAGKRMLLCRFKYCNRICNWCDTLVKMRVHQEASYELHQLQSLIDKHKCGLMITGGEPTFEDQYWQTKNMLTELIYPYANVESNGYNLKDLMDVIPRVKPITFIYSPKFFNEDELLLEIDRTKYLINDIKDGRSIIKLVYQNNDVIHNYLEFLETLSINDKIFLMPEGITREKLIENAAITFDAAETYKVGFSSRDHIIYEFI